MNAVVSLSNEVGVRIACDAFAVPRASFYRWKRPKGKAPGRLSPLALSQQERQDVLAVLHDQRFIDKAPQEIYAGLLDQGTYLCSIRTMYRILESHGEIKERRNQLSHPRYQRPELLATAPNQV